MSTSKFAKLLNIGFGIKDVILKSVDFIDKIVTFRCSLKKPLKKCAKCCSKNVRIKDTKVRRLRMVPLGMMKCFLEITIHKFKCKDCGASAWVNLPFAAGKFPLTKAFMYYVLALVKLGTIQAISIFVDLQWKTVKNIHKDYLSQKYQKISYKKLLYVTVDEFSIKKGHKYMTVFADLCTGRIVHAVEGRSVEDIKPFLEKLSKRARKLRAIAMDLSPSYTSAVKQYLPGVDIVFDRFHVMKLLNEVLDELRRKEREKYIAAGSDVGKGDRFLFLRNFEDLDDKQRSKLDRLFKVNESLAKAHTMKEQFRTFWDKPSKKEGAKFLCHWIYEAVHSRIKPLMRVGKTILRHYEGLLSYFDHFISNGKAEGINNKIKVLKRSGYGYRDMEYFTLLLYDLHEKTTALVG